MPTGGVGGDLPPRVVQGDNHARATDPPMQSSGDTHNAVPETLLVAQVECGPGSRSYSWSSLRAAAKSAEFIEQLIAILYCRASTGDLLIANDRVSAILAPSDGLYPAPPVAGILADEFGALQSALDAREARLNAVNNNTADATSGSQLPKIEGERRSPGGRTYEECALEVSARIAGKRMRPIEVITPSGDLVLRVAPKVRLLAIPPDQHSSADTGDEELVRNAQPLSYLLTVTGRAVLMQADAPPSAGAEIRIPIDLNKLKRLSVYRRDAADERGMK